MKTLLTRALGGLLLTACSAPLAWGQVAVPFNFIPNTPAVSAQVNANFQALVNAINSHFSETTTIPSGYRHIPPFTTNTASPNVIVLKYTSGSETRYKFQITYDDGTSGIWVSSFVHTSDGTTVIRWGNSKFSISSPHSPSFTLPIIAVRQETGTQTTTPITSAAANSFDPSLGGNWVFQCFGVRRNGTLRLCLTRLSDLSTNNEISTASFPRTEAVLTGSAIMANTNYVYNGLTFTDLLMRNDGGAAGTERIIARNIGTVAEKLPNNFSESARAVIYYRMEGVAQGSLAGTPFESGGAAFGAFFTP